MDQWLDAIEEAKTGNPEAVNRLCRLIRPAVRKTVYGLLGIDPNPDDVEDIVQGALFRVQSSLHSFDPSRSTFSWIKKLALNELIDFKRRAKKFGRPKELEEGDAVTEPDSVSSALERSYDADRLRLCLDRHAGEQDRELFELHHIEEISLQEIASRMGQEVSQVKGRLHRFRLKVQECLKAGGVQK